MASMSKSTVTVSPDAGALARVCRTVAKHLLAMADDLDAMPEAEVEIPTGAEGQPS